MFGRLNGPENAGSVLNFVRAGLEERQIANLPLCSAVAAPPALARWAYPDSREAGTTSEQLRCRLLPPAAIRNCFRGRSITMLGDSTGRDLVLAMASWFGGLEPVQFETNRSSRWHGGAAVYESRHPSRRGIMQSDGLTPNINECGTHMISSLNLTLSYCEYGNHSLMSEMLQRPRERCSSAQKCDSSLVFVLFGAHYTSVSPVVHQWINSSDAYVHGAVFQPFLDAWCDSLRDHPPLVWLPLNPRCRSNLPLKWQLQKEVTAGANRGALRAANVDIRVPLVDINRVFSEGAASEDEFDERVCNVTADGIHFPQAIDAFRAHYLLSHFCDEHGGFRQVSLPATFDRTKAHCGAAARGAVATSSNAAPMKLSDGSTNKGAAPVAGKKTTHKQDVLATARRRDIVTYSMPSIALTVKVHTPGVTTATDHATEEQRELRFLIPITPDTTSGSQALVRTIPVDKSGNKSFAGLFFEKKSLLRLLDSFDCSTDDVQLVYHTLKKHVGQSMEITRAEVSSTIYQRIAHQNARV